MQPERLSSRLTARASGWLSEHAPQRVEPMAEYETSESPAPVEDIDDLEDTGPMLMMVGGASDPRSTDLRDTISAGNSPDLDRSPSSYLPTQAPTLVITDGPEITCRSVTRYDHNLLRAIFVECRSIGLTSLPVALAGALLDMQYRAHRSDRGRHWPTAESEIVQVRGVPAGLLTVAVDRNEIRIVDLDIMMGFRRQGVGSHIIETIQQNAVRRGLPLRATVSRANVHALGICTRRGLQQVGGSSTDMELEWRP